MIKGILFDLFGALVDYSPSRVEQGYHATHSMLIDPEGGFDAAPGDVIQSVLDVRKHLARR